MLAEHIASILFVTGAFVGLIAFLQHRQLSREEASTRFIGPYLRFQTLDFGNPLDQALFRETLRYFHPADSVKNEAILQAIEAYRMEQFTTASSKTGAEPAGLTKEVAGRLGGMYAQFIGVYVIVMILTYYGARALAVYRFVRMKQGRSSYLEELAALFSSRRRRAHGGLGGSLFLPVKILLKGVVYAVLFSPAYVIAYSIKSDFDTSSLLFMVVLGAVSNGLLVTLANRMYTFLVSEGRKGYVLTAMVKNLDSSYAWHVRGGIPYRAMIEPGRLLPLHVFRHVYMNARYQYLPTLKEHASFLITGLIIIEMALNIQGHLGYELLQNTLFKRYDIVIAIILGIFLVVKATEIIIDAWCIHERRKYGNADGEE